MPDLTSNNFKIVDPTKVKNWNEKILNSTQYSIFLTSNWARVLADTYDFKPKYFAIDGNNAFEFLLPFMEIDHFLTGKKGVSLPFTDFCEPIYQNNFLGISEIEKILKIAENFGWKSLELRGANRILKEQTPSTSYYSHDLKLSSENNLYSGLKSNVRRNLKRAHKEGLQIKIEDSLQSVKIYYQLHCLTRKKHGLPPQPFRFFENIYKHIISHKFGKIISASVKDKVVASAIFLYFGGQVIYKFGASDWKYQQYRANNLVMWEAIRYFTKCGFKKFHFGKTEFQNEGLRRFKLGWGTKEYAIHYYKYSTLKNSFISEKSRENGWYNLILNKTPVHVLRLIGSIMYKHAA